MSRLSVLPQIMLAPNGARRTKADHPALPITISETVLAAKAGFEAGAGALHAHVRDDDGAHALDAGLYRELIAEMARAVPDMPVQITTEAVGRYPPEEQRAVVEAVCPEGVSVALREMWPVEGPDAEASAFYHWAADEGIAVQHILYAPDQVARLARLVRDGHIPSSGQLLFVLGQYDPPRNGTPDDLTEFIAAMDGLTEPADWAACAFGRRETDCLLAAIAQGGKARIGFENNLLGSDGKPALDNAARVRALCEAIATGIDP